MISHDVTCMLVFTADMWLDDRAGTVNLAAAAAVVRDANLPQTLYAYCGR